MKSRRQRTAREIVIDSQFSNENKYKRRTRVTFIFRPDLSTCACFLLTKALSYDDAWKCVVTINRHTMTRRRSFCCCIRRWWSASLPMGLPSLDVRLEIPHVFQYVLTRILFDSVQLWLWNSVEMAHSVYVTPKDIVSQERSKVGRSPSQVLCLCL